MPYVERNIEDQIIAVYQMPQPDIAEEFLEYNDEELAAYMNSAERQDPVVIDLDELENRVTALEGVS